MADTDIIRQTDYHISGQGNFVLWVAKAPTDSGMAIKPVMLLCATPGSF